MAAPQVPPFVAKGPGIKGGGIAAVGAGFGAMASIIVAIMFVAGSDAGFNNNDPWYLLTSQLALWVGMVGAVLVASRVNGSGSLSTDFGLSFPRRRDLSFGLAGGIAGRMLPLLFVILIVLADRQNFSTPNSTAVKVLGTTPSGVAGWAIVIALAVIGAPLVEELFFRGLLQGAFTRRVGSVPAIFITALIFSFAHILNEGPFAPLILFPAALILGYLRHRTGRLAAGMAAHSIFNATLFVLFLVPAFR